MTAIRTIIASAAFVLLGATLAQAEGDQQVHQDPDRFASGAFAAASVPRRPALASDLREIQARTPAPETFRDPWYFSHATGDGSNK